MSKEERIELSFKAFKLIQTTVFPAIPVSGSMIQNMLLSEKLYDDLSGYGYSYAELYLSKCWDENEMINNADVTIYKQILEIDLKLGVTHTQQLFDCVYHSYRIDLIKV